MGHRLSQLGWCDLGKRRGPTYLRQPATAPFLGNDVFAVAAKWRLSQRRADRLVQRWSTLELCFFPAGIPQIRGVIFGDAKLVAVVDGGTVLTSSNGVDWSLTTVGGT